MPRAPDEPSADERARHEVTHLPYQLWCACCVMEKAAWRHTRTSQWRVLRYQSLRWTSAFFSKTPSADKFCLTL